MFLKLVGRKGLLINIWTDELMINSYFIRFQREDGEGKR